MHSKESIRLLADKLNLKILKIVSDSTPFEIWGSEQYKKGIPLSSDQSYGKNREKSIFSKSDMKEIEQKAKTLNEKGVSGRIAIYLQK